MRVLITGSEGFIGQHLVRYLEQQGIRVIRYDLKLGLDIFDEWALYMAVRDCDLIVNLAGCTAVPVSYKVPFNYYRVNTEGAARVFRAASEYKKKVIHASTGEVYVGNSPYAASKIGAEAAADAEAMINDAKIVCLRFLNPYGAGQPHSYVIPLFLRKALKGEPLTIHGEGQHAKDYIYVSDIAEAIWTARRLPFGLKVDVGSGKVTSINQIADVVEKVVAPQPVTRTYTDKGKRIGEKEVLKGNVKPLLDLGWKPKISLEEGVKLVKEDVLGDL